jgi:hypothetical protein
MRPSHEGNGDHEEETECWKWLIWLREWQGIPEGLVARVGECCDSPSLYVVSTVLSDCGSLQGLLRCSRCERFACPRPLWRDGAFGAPRWGKAAVHRFHLYAESVHEAYTH